MTSFADVLPETLVLSVPIGFLKRFVPTVTFVLNHRASLATQVAALMLPGFLIKQWANVAQLLASCAALAEHDAPKEKKVNRSANDERVVVDLYTRIYIGDAITVYNMYYVLCVSLSYSFAFFCSEKNVRRASRARRTRADDARTTIRHRSGGSSLTWSRR